MTESIDRDEHDRIIAAALRRVTAPAYSLMWVGFVGMLMTCFFIWLQFMSGIDLSERMLVWTRDNMAPSQQAKDDIQIQINHRLALDKTMEKVMSGFMYGLIVIGNVLIFIAGWQMRQLKSHTFCIVGTVFTFFLNGCCCFFSVPIGIWSLVVINNREVKAGFEAMKRQTY